VREITSWKGRVATAAAHINLPVTARDESGAVFLQTFHLLIPTFAPRAYASITVSSDQIWAMAVCSGEAANGIPPSTDLAQRFTIEPFAIAAYLVAEM